VNSKRIVVRGKVQNVGFRHFVSQRARSLGIRGEVWNRRDGAVELVAGHDALDVLDSLIEALNEGPGRIESVFAVDESPALHEYFRIAHSR
jgi:acylphosphatase